MVCRILEVLIRNSYGFDSERWFPYDAQPGPVSGTTVKKNMEKHERESIRDG